jgi:CheY-like chemotaxis protein
MYIETLFEKEIDGVYTLIHAKNGKEAVDICYDNNEIDIVLMDIKMPVMNGHRATVKIKTKYPDLPVIAQTAYSTESEKQKALNSGCDDFISKPIDKEQLLSMINTYLG